MADKNNIFRTSQRQIGKTIYTVITLPSERAKETAEQRLSRFVKEKIIAGEPAERSAYK